MCGQEWIAFDWLCLWGKAKYPCTRSKTPGHGGMEETPLLFRCHSAYSKGMSSKCKHLSSLWAFSCFPITDWSNVVCPEKGIKEAERRPLLMKAITIAPHAHSTKLCDAIWNGREATAVQHRNGRAALHGMGVWRSLLIDLQPMRKLSTCPGVGKFQKFGVVRSSGISESKKKVR